MRVIKTLRNIRCLGAAGALDTAYLNLIDGFFRQLSESLGDGQPADEFSLDQHGYFVVLERGDDVRDLSTVGLTRGLLESGPEFVEVADLGHMAVYKVAVLYNNEYMMFFFSAVGQFDPETEAWLKEQAG